MEQNCIASDKFAHSIQLSAYTSVSDVEGIEKTLTRMDSDPNFFFDWTTYTVAAKGYTKLDLLTKALEMLKKSDRLISGKKTNEVLRIWELYKKNEKVYKEAYISITASLLKLDDFEIAEKIFEEWEFRNHLCYGNVIPNFLIDESYLRNGQTLKAMEAMKKEVVVSGRRWKPSNESLATCLEYLKEEGDLEKVKDFMELLRRNDIISLDIQERLLNHIKDTDSSSDVLSALNNNYLRFS
eukprot:XP_024459528.1 pentatricopeptide repeat-containing protein At2g20710, mitochondrial-like [Populus trichocarpa]